jgi:signal transduction histidine kinase
MRPLKPSLRKLKSFRVRLLLWNSGVLATALVAFGAAVGQGVQSDAAAAIDRELLARARPFAVTQFPLLRQSAARPEGPRAARRAALVDRLPAQELPLAAAPALRTPRPGALGVMDARAAEVDAEARRLVFFHRARVLSRDGRGVGRFAGDSAWDARTFRLALAGQMRYSTLDVFQTPIRVISVPLYHDGEVVGAVQVAHEVTELEKLHGGVIRNLLILVPLALIAAGTGGLFLTDRALGPIGAITEAAAEISSRHLSRRLRVQGHDELAELATTFNGMLGRLEEAFGKLEAAYEQLRRFTADVSHELRTPLTRLKGSLALARREPDEVDHALDLSEAAVEGMQRLVQDLLHLARVDAGQFRPLLRPLELGDLLDEVTAFVPDSSGVIVRLDVPPEGVRLWGDRLHLSRLFTNLLENAHRHTGAGGSITVTAGAESGRVIVRIEDTGEGIPPEHLPHLFERFYRVDSSRDRQRGGTGLGLAIAQSIAHSHDGEIVITSEEGRGTQVTVTLAREPVQEAPAGTSA